MARIGRTQSTRPLRYGIPPTEAPGPPTPTAPVAGGVNISGGGRHGRASRSQPLVQYAPRPLFTATVYTDSGAATLALGGTSTASQTYAATTTAASTLSASATASQAYTASSASTLATSATSTASITFTASPATALALSGSSSTSTVYADTLSAVLTLAGSSVSVFIVTSGPGHGTATDTTLNVATLTDRAVTLAGLADSSLALATLVDTDLP